MPRRIRVPSRGVVTFAMIFGLLAAIAVSAPAGAASPPNLVAVMTADQYVPPPLGPLFPEPNALQDVTGTASISLGSDPGIICFHLVVPISPDQFGVLDGRLHRGAPGVAGPEVATLLFTPYGARTTTGCTSGLGAALLFDLFTHPERYYVEVILANPQQNDCGPDVACFFGAIRGQLAFEAVPAPTAAPPLPNAAVPTTGTFGVPLAPLGLVLIMLALVTAQAPGLSSKARRGRRR